MPPQQSKVKEFKFSATSAFLKVRQRSKLFKLAGDESKSSKGIKQTKQNEDAKTNLNSFDLTSMPMKDKESCEVIIEALSNNEIESAARSSFEYFKYVVPDPKSGRSCVVDDKIRRMYAMKMARRHLVAEKGNTVAAIQKMKSTIAFREDMNIDAMRQCFYNLNYEESKVLTQMRKGLERELSDGKHIVRGHDLANHSFFIIFPRRYTSFDQDWYLKGKLYSLERAIAYTERISGGTVEKVNVVFDYKDYVPEKHEPPLSLIKELLFCLRDHYPERLEHMFFIDAPFRFRAFWALVKPFIDPVTKRKIQFISGNAQKHSAFQGFVAPDESMSFMHLNGCRPDEYNIEKWTYMIPFDYDVDQSPL